LREKHGADQHVQDREEGNQNPDSPSKKVTGNKDWEVVEIKDEGDFLDEVGTDKGGYENDDDKNLLEMFHDELLRMFHNVSPLTVTISVPSNGGFILIPCKKIDKFRVR